MITAKTYQGDIESLLKSALVQGLWNDEKKRGGIFSTNFDKTIAAVVQRIDDNAKREVETSSINADWVMAGRSSIIYGLLVDSLSTHFQNTPDIFLYTQAIRQALQTDRVSAARNIFKAIPPSLAVDPELKGIGDVLALPVVHLVRKNDTDRSEEFDWLRTEGHKYRGQWVAIENRQLLVAAPSLKALRSQLKTNHQNRFPLIHRVV